MAQYTALFTHHTDAIVLVDRDGFIVEANRAFLALTQWEQAAVVQQRYEQFFQLEAQTQLEMFEQRAHLICQHGHQIPILIQKIEAADSLFIVAKDMRALDAIAENYLTSELRYRAIAENIQDVLILMDAHKHYLYVSPSAQAMFQFDYRKLADRKAFFNIHDDDVGRLDTLFQQAMCDGKSFAVKLKAWHEEKGWVWTEMKGHPMFNEGQFQHMLLVARDISIQHSYEERLVHEAYNDALTALPNRRKLNVLLQSAQQGVHQQHFAVMLMDVDNFKHINDSYGHEIGDHVLVEYGQRITDALGQRGVVGRYGGDEFLVILPYERLQQLEEVAARIVRVMQQPIEIQQAVLSITTSIGIACIEEDMTVRTMIKCADDALYNVKKQGKNSFYIKTPKKQM